MAKAVWESKPRHLDYRTQILQFSLEPLVQIPFDTEGDTEAQECIKAFSKVPRPRHRHNPSFLATSSGLPGLWRVVGTPWWPFPRRPASPEPQVKQMTQREGTAFSTPPRPAALRCLALRPPSRRVATCLGETRKAPPLALGGGGGAPSRKGVSESATLAGRREDAQRASAARSPIGRDPSSPSRDWTIIGFGPVSGPGRSGGTGRDRRRVRRVDCGSGSNGVRRSVPGALSTQLALPVRQPVSFRPRLRMLGGGGLCVPLSSELGF